MGYRPPPPPPSRHPFAGPRDLHLSFQERIDRLEEWHHRVDTAVADGIDYDEAVRLADETPHAEDWTITMTRAMNYFQDFGASGASAAVVPIMADPRLVQTTEQ